MSCWFDFSLQMDSPLLTRVPSLAGRAVAFDSSCMPILVGGFSLLLPCCSFDNIRKKSFVRGNSHMSWNTPRIFTRTVLILPEEIYITCQIRFIAIGCWSQLMNKDSASCSTYSQVRYLTIQFDNDLTQSIPGNPGYDVKLRVHELSEDLPRPNTESHIMSDKQIYHNYLILFEERMYVLFYSIKRV